MFLFNEGKYSTNPTGGACNQEFHANTFEEIAELSKAHGMEMFQKQDESHLEAMNKIQELMKKPGAMEEWLESKRQEFEGLSEN